MRVHNQISRGDLTAAATRALGVTKNEGGVERYSETVEIVMNPWGMPEWASLRGEYQGATREVVAGVAAELGMIAIVSPASSGLLVVVEYAQFRGTTGAQLELVAEANIVASLLTPGTPLPRDTRGGATWVPQAPARAGLGGDQRRSLGRPDRRAKHWDRFYQPPGRAVSWMGARHHRVGREHLDPGDLRLARKDSLPR